MKLNWSVIEIMDSAEIGNPIKNKMVIAENVSSTASIQSTSMENFRYENIHNWRFY